MITLSFTHPEKEIMVTKASKAVSCFDALLSALSDVSAVMSLLTGGLVVFVVPQLQQSACFCEC